MGFVVDDTLNIWTGRDDVVYELSVKTIGLLVFLILQSLARMEWILQWK